MIVKAKESKGPSHCWECGRRLVYRKDGGFKYALIEDPDGNLMRVHKDCVKNAVGGGYREYEQEDAMRDR